MSEQKESVEKLFSNPGFPFKALLDSAYFAIIAIDKEGYLAYINKVASSLLDLKMEVNPRSIHYSDIDNDTWLDFKKDYRNKGNPQIAVSCCRQDMRVTVQQNPHHLGGRTGGGDECVS